MICSCGGETADRTVVRNKRVVAEYRICRQTVMVRNIRKVVGCGRILWLWRELCWKY